MKYSVLMASLVLCLLSPGAVAQDTVKDGLTIWTTSWDDGSVDVGYEIIKWTYYAQDGIWEPESQYVAPPEVADEDYFGNVYDMGMDMMVLPGTDERSAILTVSKGNKHFPSLGTEFQHRKLNEIGEWELVQPPLFTTPPDVSPLGVDIYQDGGEIHIAWIEDNDADGPNSMMCDIFDRVFTVTAEGLLEPAGDPVLAFSRKLNWGGSHPGPGGITGLTVCDYDADGDMDFVVGKMFYGDSPAGTAIQLIERLSPDDWADELQELWAAWPGTGSEGVCACDVDGDDQLDLINTTGWEGPWSTVFWFEKKGDDLVEVDYLLETRVWGEPFGISPGHIFGLHAPPPQVQAVENWEILR